MKNCVLIKCHCRYINSTDILIILILYLALFFVIFVAKYSVMAMVALLFLSRAFKHMLL